MTSVEWVATLIIACLLLLAWWLLFRTKRRHLEPFPETWRKLLHEHVDFYRDISSEGKKRFETDVQIFLQDVEITGIETEIDDLDRLLVAASAVIPIFRFPDWQYHNINEVLIYPGPFNQEYQTMKGEDRNILGMVGSGSMQRMMILSRQALRAGFQHTASVHNAGIHEFVHLLDKADGATDGIPELFLARPYIIPWVKTMHQEIQAIQEGRSDINVYGAKNEAEFFSVVSEYFFRHPELLKERHPELYAMLDRIFGHTPSPLASAHGEEHGA